MLIPARPFLCTVACEGKPQRARNTDKYFMLYHDRQLSLCTSSEFSRTLKSPAALLGEYSSAQAAWQLIAGEQECLWGMPLCCQACSTTSRL